MSHFTVLAAVDVPDLSCERQRSTERQAQIEKVRSACAEDQQNFGLKFALNRLLHNPSELESTAEQCVDMLLEPYSESTENMAYLVFCNMEDEYREEYRERKYDCVRLPNGLIVPSYDERFRKLYALHEGKVYKRSFGPQKHRKRTKKAKAIELLPQFPLNKLYPSYQCFLEQYHGYIYYEEEGACGYYSNPNAKWDWYQIGGRWPYRFLVKEDCRSVVFGGQSFLLNDEQGNDRHGAPEGYRWVAGARKKDVAWSVMKEFWLAETEKAFSIYGQWFRSGEKPEAIREYAILTPDGVRGWCEWLYKKGETLEDYLTRNGLGAQVRYPLGTSAYVDENGWEESADIGWFGSSSDESKLHIWYQMVDQFIASLPEDKMLVSVDCHV